MAVTSLFGIVFHWQALLGIFPYNQAELSFSIKTLISGFDSETNSVAGVCNWLVNPEFSLIVDSVIRTCPAL